MTQFQENTFRAIVAQYLGRQLPAHMTEAISFTTSPRDVQSFISRMLSLMQRADFPATDFTPALIRQLADVIPGFLPCAWSGRVPPLTLSKRNAKIDAYIGKQSWPESLVAPVFVDMGCGFPPITTIDSVAALPGWRVFGIDRFFPDYVVYADDGTYACFDGQGVLQYFQPKMDIAGIGMYRQQSEVRRRFDRIFENLQPLLSKGMPSAGERVEENGHTLIHHPIRKYETANLTFIESEMGEAQVPPCRAIRCMNTLMYFAPKTRQNMLAKAGALLDDRGILIVGANLMNGAGCRYIVYKRDKQCILPEEFALSVDNLRPIGVMPWYTLHDDDPEALMLADVLRQVRTDRAFWREFAGRLDELLAQYGLFQRHSNGFFYNFEEKASVIDFPARISCLWRQVEEEGFADGAVDALRRAGYTSWKNPVGDIAVRPNAFSLDLPTEGDGGSA